VRVEWDDRKAAANQAKHGISFAMAITAFDDPSLSSHPMQFTRRREKNDGG